MNVIVANKYSQMLSNLRIDIIKNVEGEFDVEDIVSNFQNFFFNKMILDITAIKDYQNIATIQKLSFGLDMSKVILLLDDSQIVNSPSYISELISMGIYNFTRNIDAVAYLINNPNTYKDVAQYHILGASGAKADTQANISLDPGQINSNFINESVNKMFMGTRVIAVKNLSDGAGATTLTYMMKKALEGNYRVLAIEVDKKDFMYFNDSDLRSVTTAELETITKNPNSDYEVILVDINDSPKISTIKEVIHLVEPTTIKLNKMIRTDRLVLEKMKSYQVVLNKSLLNDKDVEEFEYESRCKTFANLPYLDDKQEDNKDIKTFLYKMGFDKLIPEGLEKKTVKWFGIVKDE
ncbi:MAG: hypothetical protein E7159_03890 [Firmicutes bacterium]|nr:hypothetical protein [Bacillota bacterium]